MVPQWENTWEFDTYCELWLMICDLLCSTEWFVGGILNVRMCVVLATYISHMLNKQKLLTTIRLPENGTPLPKHEGVWYLSFVFHVILCTFWLIYCSQRFEVVLSILDHHTLDPLPVVKLHYLSSLCRLNGMTIRTTEVCQGGTDLEEQTTFLNTVFSGR
jgi:hypothetical protein